ncbi:nucleotidyltransferase domain-containing protein [Armatimonas sp.]|uniref:nucleotidyltransferase domain-containing protein n=1 Tax=Armatimonas sp. TaxID=1872638 RepID=UPI003753A153
MQHEKIVKERCWPSTALFVPFGSRVYGTARLESDHDYLVVFPENNGPSGLELVLENTNLHTYTLTEFQAALDTHQIHALEAYFAPESPLPALCTFTLNRATLRQALSQKASHSFVKAKKKIAVEQDYLAGWKSLFHSLRILVFGIELAQTGALTNFAAANAYWDEIWAAQETDWETLKTRWQPVHNALSSEFRKLAPKE